MNVKLDASGKILGKLAVEIANHLRGKDSPLFSKNIDPKNRVFILNSDQIVVTGNKYKDKKYFRHSSRIGNLKTVTYEQMMQKDPNFIIRHAVAGMLPKNKLCRKMLKRIHFVSNKNN